MSERKRPRVGKVVRDTLTHAWKASPAVFSALIAGSLLYCATQALELFALRGFFDAVALCALGQLPIESVARAALPVALFLLAGPLVNIIEYLAQGYFWRRGSGYLLSRFHLRIGKLRLIDFESGDTFDDMKKARLASEGAPAAARSVVQFVFHYLPYLLLSSAFLFAVKPALVLATLLIFASVLASQYVRATRVYQFEQETAGLKRQVEYYDQCITGKECFKETRTLGAFAYFRRALADSTSRYAREAMRMEKRIAAVELALRLVNALGYAGILALLLYYVHNGSVTVGAFAAVFYSVERISGVLTRMVQDVGEIFENMGTSSFFFGFLKPEDCPLRERPLPKDTDIHVKGVSFAYPGGGEVIRGIDLTIPRGETVAIVGENGAGKTTLTKLIAGLYTPTRGAVLFGDDDIGGYAPAPRYRGISGVFQNYARYRMTLRENIHISDMAAKTDVEDACGKAGVGVRGLEKGLDTMLSREFGGAELSGGQWQRVAIARGLYREHELIILDEPTAAIDPVEESKIFRLFEQSARGKTAVLVTHRLGSAKIARMILVMEKGEIVERGSHAELMALGGTYRRMFEEQAKWYERAE